MIWQITDASPDSPKFPPSKYSRCMVYQRISCFEVHVSAVVTSVKNVYKLAIGHFLTNFGSWLTKIYFNQPSFPCIFNGTVLYYIPSLKIANQFLIRIAHAIETLKN